MLQNCQILTKNCNSNPKAFTDLGMLESKRPLPLEPHKSFAVNRKPESQI